MLRENEMKKNKWLMGVGIVLSCFTLTACSNSGSKSSNSKQDKTVQVKKSKPKTSNNGIKTVNINKNTNVVSGAVKVHFDSVKYETVKNKESNYTDAEENIEGNPSKVFNSPYYRATVLMTIENVGSQTVDLSYGNRSIILDNGQAISSDGFGSGNGTAFMTSNNSIAPKSKLTTSVIIVSNNKIKADHPSFNFEDLCNSNGDQIAAGGVAKIQ